MTLKEYYHDCARHDWFYDYSDDFGVWKRGSQHLDELTMEARKDPEKQKIFDSWKNHMFSGVPWGTEKAPKPVEPVDVET